MQLRAELKGTKVSFMLRWREDRSRRAAMASVLSSISRSHWARIWARPVRETSCKLAIREVVTDFLSERLIMIVTVTIIISGYVDSYLLTELEIK